MGEGGLLPEIFREAVGSDDAGTNFFGAYLNTLAAALLHIACAIQPKNLSRTQKKNHLKNGRARHMPFATTRLLRGDHVIINARIIATNFFTKKKMMCENMNINNIL